MKHLFVQPAGTIFTAVLLSGCGGSGSDSASYNELLDTTQTLSERLDSALPTQILPSAGNAIYSGGTAFAAGEGREAADILENADLVSQLELKVDFDPSGDGISGSMTDFKSRDGRPVTGSVVIYNGSIMNENELIANFDGRSLLIDGEPVGFAEDGVMTGGFFEPNAALIGGGLATTGYTGVFAAEK